MKNSLKYPISICLFLFLAQISWSKSESTECPKLTEPLCTAVNNKSNDDTIYVNFILREAFAPLPDSCKSVDMKAHPDSNCVERMDAAYWEKLKEENKEVYASYSSMMKNVMNPSQILPYRGDSTTLIVGAVVTKMNLLVIVQDSNLVGAEPFYYSFPTVVAPQITAHSINSIENSSNYSANGQLIQSTSRSKSFKVKFQK